jgi:hypothetical protein
MKLIHLNDAELDAVVAAARPIAVDRSDAFLQQVASYREIGPGLVHRVVAQVQREYANSGGESTRG